MLNSANAPRPPGGELASDTETGGIAAALLTVSRAVNRAKFHDALCKQAGVDLDRSGSAVLYSLYSQGGDVRLTELAERLGTDSPAVTRKAQQLERAGLLCRTADPEDARAVRLSLTQAGQDAIERLLIARQEWLSAVLEGWPDSDRSEFARLLQQFAQTVSTRGGADDGE